MNIFLLIMQIACLLLLLWLIFMFFLQRRSKNTPPETDSFPTVSVIIPVTGSNQNLTRNLRSILDQHYPRFEVFFVVKDRADSAVPVLSQLCRQYRNATLIEAGAATHCSQKNHSLLIGVREAGSTDIIVFCDSSHLAAPSWLKMLVLPLATSPATRISSGYHQVHVTEGSLMVIGRAVCVLAMGLARMIPGFEQPWGGAMAVRRADFISLGIARLWSTTVVDDVTLASRLDTLGEKTTIPHDCDLKTIISQKGWAAWQSWMIRQWAYLKFIYPILWMLLGLCGILFSLSIFTVTAVSLLGIFLDLLHPYVFQSLIALVLFIIFSFSLRLLHPQPGPLVLWLPAVYSALFMAGWCHMRTWFDNTITWAGITYTVGDGGRVLTVRRNREDGR